MVNWLPNRLPSQQEQYANGRRWLELATPAQFKAGLNWYREANEWAFGVALGTPFTREQVAGVVTALSPRCRWDTNKRWAVRLVSAALSGLEEPPPVHTRFNRSVAWAVLNGQDPATTFRAPKQAAFYRNLTLDLDAVTLDTWMFYAMTGTRLKHLESFSRGSYAQLADTITRIAQDVGLKPAEVQAIVWGVVRGSFE